MDIITHIIIHPSPHTSNRQSSHELSLALNEIGVNRHDCIELSIFPRPFYYDAQIYVKNTKASRIPTPELQLNMERFDARLQELSLTHKHLVLIPLGDLPLWACTSERGITSWRGSYLDYNPPVASPPPQGSVTVVPTYDPAKILKMWEWRAIMVHDLRRAFTPIPLVPTYNFLTRPKYSETLAYINNLLLRIKRYELVGEVLWLSVDIETRSRHIACVGIASDKFNAICIPFMCVERDEGYWSLDEEFILVKKLSALFTHPNVRLIGQNFIYDVQYFAKHWGISIPPHFDTMISHAVLFPGTPKGLDYLSSMYCRYHRYWKGESKDWDPKVGEDQLWIYNCKDAVITFEVFQALVPAIKSRKLQSPQDFEFSLIPAILQMMYRGVRINMELRSKLLWELQESLEQRRTWLDSILPQDDLSLTKTKAKTHWSNSPPQQRTLFYERFKLKPIRNRKTGRPTCDDVALKKLSKTEPLLSPVFDVLSESRSIGVFLNTFVRAPLDKDHRIRCSYNPVGTETFRFSSSEDAFGFGTNLQNIPATDGGLDERGFSLPNIRELFIPDPGYIILDVDLDRADLQIVVWEAGDEELKAILREGVDIHSENAKVLHCSRPLAKKFTHAVNYGARARTVASGCGLTVHYAEAMIDRWFSAHPKIKLWHDRIENDLRTTRSVTNVFGFKRFYFGRIETLLGEALAWCPQSSVAIIINQGLLNVYNNLPEVHNLLQVHDSLVLQIPRGKVKTLLPKIQSELLIPVPYLDPLTIPVGVKLSSRSWGECREVPWDFNSPINW